MWSITAYREDIFSKVGSCTVDCPLSKGNKAPHPKFGAWFPFDEGQSTVRLLERSEYGLFFAVSFDSMRPSLSMSKEETSHHLYPSVFFIQNCILATYSILIQ